MDFNKLFILFKKSKNQSNLTSVPFSRSQTITSSKTNNPKVLIIYHEILENAFVDSDYWTLHGNGLILEELSKFNDNDWQELENDLVNWEPNQLEIFGFALTFDYSGGYNSIIDKRSYLFGYALSIFPKTEINPLLEVIDFFIKEGKSKPLWLLQKINNVLNEYGHTNDFIESRKEMINQSIQKASA